MRVGLGWNSRFQHTWGAGGWANVTTYVEGEGAQIHEVRYEKRLEPRLVCYVAGRRVELVVLCSRQGERGEALR